MKNDEPKKSISIVQLSPRLGSGGIERGVVDLAIALKKAGFNSLVISGGGFLEKELNEHKVTHINLPIYSKNPLVFIVNLFRLAKVLKAIQPDLVHPHSRIPTWLIYFLQKQLSLRWLSSCNGIHSLDKWGFKKIYNGVLTQGEIIIANSKFTKEYLVRNYEANPERIRVIYRGIDPEKLNPATVDPDKIQALRNLYKISPDKIVILLPARFAHWKGQHVFVEACHLLKTQYKLKFSGLLVGSTKNKNYTAQVKALIKKYDLDSDLILTGESQDMKSFYALSDLIVSTSIEPEAFGRTNVEAQLMQKPIIATRHGGACETIIQGESGWLYEPDDAAELARTIVEVSHLPKESKEKILNKARQDAINLFSKDKMCNQYIEIYKECLS